MQAAANRDEARAGPVGDSIPEVGEAPVRDQRFYTEQYLDRWARWMRMGGKPVGCPGKASGGLNGYTIHTGDADYEYEECRGAAITNAVINDLPIVEQCALHHAYLDAVYRFTDRLRFEVALERAVSHVSAGLLRKGIWLGA